MSKPNNYPIYCNQETWWYINITVILCGVVFLFGIELCILKSQVSLEWKPRRLYLNWWGEGYFDKGGGGWTSLVQSWQYGFGLNFFSIDYFVQIKIYSDSWKAIMLEQMLCQVSPHFCHVSTISNSISISIIKASADHLAEKWKAL
jgi:hypothetical protein